MVEVHGTNASNLRADLKQLKFPATKEQVVSHLSENGLTDRATVAKKLPDREYVNADAVQSEYTKHESR
ncbi:DUF2795 domain-containing protein [Streptomyces sp. NPDC048473]|uniref:DUF2795 domain-containing protein n=1 Tax=unclassified Streptomyces TaxID=2593676 RepID=UPI00372473AA